MFGLTRQERQVILFLISIILLGLGINFLAKQYSQVKEFINFNPDIGKYELNKADKETLISIPGIGEKLAQRIIEYRRQNSNFNNIQELKNIKGITGYRFEKLKDYLYVK